MAGFDYVGPSFLILALTGYKVGPILTLFACFDSSERSKINVTEF